MTDLPILYSFRRCPYAIRARLALKQANISLELRELLLKDKPADMLKHSPKGTVPVLIRNDGQVIDESLDVMLWALKQHDPANWLAQESTSLTLISETDNDFKPLLDRYKYADRHPELSPAQHFQKTWPFIEKLETRLVNNGGMIDEKTRLADVAIMPFIRQYAMVDMPAFQAAPWPKLQQWLRLWLASDLMQAVMNKYKLFNAGFRYTWPGGELIEH